MSGIAVGVFLPGLARRGLVQLGRWGLIRVPETEGASAGKEAVWFSTLVRDLHLAVLSPSADAVKNCVQTILYGATYSTQTATKQMRAMFLVPTEDGSALATHTWGTPHTARGARALRFALAGDGDPSCAKVAWMAGEYYCRDVANDAHYRVKPGQHYRYRSIYSVLVGNPDKKFGILTVDCTAVDGFTLRDQDNLKAFAALLAVARAVELGYPEVARVDVTAAAKQGGEPE